MMKSEISANQSDYKEMIEQNRKLNQLYTAIIKCNKSIIKSQNREELFDEICKNAINFGNMQMAWIGVVDHDKEEIVPVAYHGEGVEYIRDLKISIDPSNDLSKGPTGQAYLEEKPYWCQNFLQDSATLKWRKKSRKFEWGSSVALPLKCCDEVVAVLNLYTKEVDNFNEEIKNLLIEVSEDISYGLNTFKQKEMREIAESKLISSNNLLKTIINTIPIRIFWKNLNSEYEGCNLAFAQDAGESSTDSLIGKKDDQLSMEKQCKTLLCLRQ